MSAIIGTLFFFSMVLTIVLFVLGRKEPNAREVMITMGWIDVYFGALLILSLFP